MNSNCPRHVFFCEILSSVIYFHPSSFNLFFFSHYKRRVQCCAAGMVNTTAVAVSVTVVGKGSNVMCPAVSVWMPNVGVMACVFQDPAYVTLASEVTTATKVTGQFSVAMQRNSYTCSSL